jgi:hypothetical protein
MMNHYEARLGDLMRERKMDHDEIIKYQYIYAYIFMIWSKYSNQKWIRRHNNYLKRITLDSLTDKKKDDNNVYILISRSTKHSYVGLTSRGYLRRYLEHVNGSKRGKAKQQGTRLSAFLRRFGAQKFVVLPLESDLEADDLNIMEKRWIHTLRPTLNTIYNKYTNITMQIQCSSHKHNKRTHKNKKRNQGKQKHDDNQLTKYIIKQTNTIYYRLQTCLRNIPPGFETEIEIERGKFDLTGKKGLLSNFGQSKIRIKDFWKPLYQCINDLKKYKGTMHIKVTRRRVGVLTPNESFVLGQLAHPKRTRRIALVEENMNLDTLIRLREKAGLLKKDRIRILARDRIQRVLSRRHHIRDKLGFTVKIPFTRIRHHNYIRKFIGTIIAEQDFGKKVKRLLTENIRIVQTKQKSIADMLHNFRRYARDFDPTEEFACTCQHNDHKVLLAKDFEGITRKVLQQNSKNIPTIDSHNHIGNILKALIDILGRLKQIRGQGATQYFGKDTNLMTFFEEICLELDLGPEVKAELCTYLRTVHTVSQKVDKNEGKGRR